MLGPAIDIYRKDATERGKKKHTEEMKRKKQKLVFVFRFIRSLFSKK